MEPAADRLAPELDRVTPGNFSFPVLKNIDAKAYYSTDEIPHALKAQITNPVLWQDCGEELVARGAEYMVEVGPGKVLAGLGKRINRSTTILPFEDLKTANQTLDTLSAFT
jgi:[acyl-carrier-protein] S-malonyltransferase